MLVKWFLDLQLKALRDTREPGFEVSHFGGGVVLEAYQPEMCALLMRVSAVSSAMSRLWDGADPGRCPGLTDPRHRCDHPDRDRGGIELRTKLVQDQEWVDQINYRVTSFPPWGVRPARITSPESVEPRLDSAPVAVERDIEEETRKTAVLGDLRALLRDGELPIELVAEAAAADLEQALEGCRSVAGIPSGREPTAVELARQRSWARHPPDELVELFGVPLLQEAIDQGKAKAAAREKAERQERGVDLVLPISPALVDELMDLWDASADRKDMAMVACAALEAIRTWINRPPPPPPLVPQVSLLDYPLMTNPGANFRQTLGR